MCNFGETHKILPPFRVRMMRPSAIVVVPAHARLLFGHDLRCETKFGSEGRRRWRPKERSTQSLYRKEISWTCSINCFSHVSSLISVSLLDSQKRSCKLLLTFADPAALLVCCKLFFPPAKRRSWRKGVSSSSSFFLLCKSCSLRSPAVHHARSFLPK